MRISSTGKNENKLLYCRIYHLVVVVRDNTSLSAVVQPLAGRYIMLVRMTRNISIAEPKDQEKYEKPLLYYTVIGYED